MKTDTTEKNIISKRPPSTVMRLARMGSMHQTRLSFMRVLLRRLATEKWKIAQTIWQVDGAGNGTCLYTATGPQRSYSLVVFANDLDPAKRSDRVIAEEWDATFTLFDGVPTEEDIARLKENVPKQEVGRISERELSLSRANRSVRLFDAVRHELAAGRQPDAELLNSVGYLMRTTAVYGSGKFGALDRRFIDDRAEFAEPFQSELLSVYMIRQFSVDMVEHLARVDAPQTAVPLDKNLRRTLGIGNSTGLGMAPFIVNHPVLFHSWMSTREEALYRVRSVVHADDQKLTQLKGFLSRQQFGLVDWHSEHPLQVEKIAALKSDLEQLADKLASFDVTQTHLWNELYVWAENTLTLEGQECLVTLLLEIYPELVDELSKHMSIDESPDFRINGKCSVAELTGIIEKHYKFALDIDFNDSSAIARYWYASEEKLEPRLGERFQEPGCEREHPLAIARDIAFAYRDLIACDESITIAEFLIRLPEHRHVIRRAQQVSSFPYAEIEDNLIASDMLPIDLLRCKLSFFGAIKFDPRSDRWVRINMFQHAPLADELCDNYDDTWVYPAVASDADG